MNSLLKKAPCIIFFAIIIASFLFFTLQQPVQFAAAAETGSGAGFTNFGEDIDEYGGINTLRKGANDTFLNYYFTNLDDNIPENELGNECAYVAIGMALAYYDTWWNDNIIPDAYEAKTQLTEDDAINFLEITESPGTTPGYVRILNPEQNEKYEVFDSIGDALERTNLLTQDDFDSRTDSELQFTTEQLDAGNPVIIDIKKHVTGQGHVMVAFAYDYDDNGDLLLYLHNGYPEGDFNSRIVVLTEDDEPNIYTATVLLMDRIPIQHVCSDNYYYTNTDGSVTAHCPCELEEHPKHTEKYSHSYQQSNSQQHSIVCSVNGIIGTEAHTFTYTSYTASSHTKSCVCGYSITEEHSFTYTGNFDEWAADPINSTHTASCSCGFSEEQPHDIEAVCLNGGWHCVCCICFGDQNEPHLAHYVDIYIDGKHCKQCTVCGYIES